MGGRTPQPPAAGQPDDEAAASDRDAASPAVRPERPTLPDLTSDETAGGWGDWREDHDDDERFRREVPPHHGTC